MEGTPDYIGVIVLGLSLLAIIALLWGIWRKIKRHTGSATIMLGAVTDLLNADMQRAAEVIVEREAKKKMGEEESGEGLEEEEEEEEEEVAGAVAAAAERVKRKESSPSDD